MKSPQVILITGCSSGFGLCIAVRLAVQGHQVYATMRNLEKSQALKEELAQRGATAKILSLDVTNLGSIHDTFKFIERESGSLDTLINNAGFALGGTFEDLSQDEIRQQFETNFFGVQNVTRAALPFMRRQRSGKIINISSIAGLYALPGLGAYNASKWALEGFSESLYYELKPFGISVCMVEPGSYKTKIFTENARFAANGTDPKSPYYTFSNAFVARIKKIRDGIMKDPDEVAALVEQLVVKKNPPFRNVPDMRSRILWSFKRIMPFSIFSLLLGRILFTVIKNNSKPEA